MVRRQWREPGDSRKCFATGTEHKATQSGPIGGVRKTTIIPWGRSAAWACGQEDDGADHQEGTGDLDRQHLLAQELGCQH